MVSIGQWLDGIFRDIALQSPVKIYIDSYRDDTDKVYTPCQIYNLALTDSSQKQMWNKVLRLFYEVITNRYNLPYSEQLDTWTITFKME